MRTTHKQTITFTEPQADFLKRTAHEFGVSLADLVRRIIDKERVFQGPSDYGIPYIRQSIRTKTRKPAPTERDYLEAFWSSQGLSARAVSLLSNNEIKTISEAISFLSDNPDKEILRWPNIGHKTLAEIKGFLADKS